MHIMVFVTSVSLICMIALEEAPQNTIATDTSSSPLIRTFGPQEKENIRDESRKMGTLEVRFLKRDLHGTLTSRTVAAIAVNCPPNTKWSGGGGSFQVDGDAARFEVGSVADHGMLLVGSTYVVRPHLGGALARPFEYPLTIPSEWGDRREVKVVYLVVEDLIQEEVTHAEAASRSFRLKESKEHPAGVADRIWHSSILLAFAIISGGVLLVFLIGDSLRRMYRENHEGP